MKDFIAVVVFVVCLFLTGLTLTDVVLAQAQRAGSKAGERKVLTITGVEYALRWCPPGTFTMGSPESEEGREDDETQHKVTLTKGFWMLETEVTQEMWESVMGSNPSYFKDKRLSVETVNWEDCQEFIRRLNGLLQNSDFKFSLPSEAQWEYACRSGATTAYYFGGDWRQLEYYGWYSGHWDFEEWKNSKEYKDGTFSKWGATTHLVGTKKSNAWGLFDMPLRFHLLVGDFRCECDTYFVEHRKRQEETYLLFTILNAIPLLGRSHESILTVAI